MNDYTKGAFECLSWIEARMVNFEKNETKWEQLKKEVDDVIHDIRKGIGVDFPHRLRAHI